MVSYRFPRINKFRRSKNDQNECKINICIEATYTRSNTISNNIFTTKTNVLIFDRIFCLMIAIDRENVAN